MLKSCNLCSKQFEANHFNQSMCSEECRLAGRRLAKSKYKMTEKGAETNKRWQSSERFKENEKRYRQKPTAKALAVQRSMRFIERHPEALEYKRRVDRIYIKRTQGRLKPWWELNSKDGCSKCGSFDHLTIDHIIPISLGGLDEISNFQVLCKPCNSSKGNRL